MYVLTAEVLEKLKADQRARMELAIELSASNESVRRWINDNSPDGPLTRIAVIHWCANYFTLRDDEIYQFVK